MNPIEQRLARLLPLQPGGTAPQWQTLDWRGLSLIHVVQEPKLLALILPLGDTGVPKTLSELVREARAERDSRGLSRLLLVLAAEHPESLADEAREIFQSGCRDGEEEAASAEPAPDTAAELQLVALSEL
ncbi:MAG: hypothetical protein D6717_05655 [Gammaproteobacteria bacterium]|nr:MAG: hypothetical protein D6717_05655 [Gammaproteobacteria bacterium]